MSSISNRQCQSPAWMSLTLRIAGVYNVLWGAWVILMPGMIFSTLSMPAPNYPGIWQCVGMIVGVYGVGYWIAASDPARHWPIVLVGLLGKTLGPIGFAFSVVGGELPLAFGWMLITNDFVWWVPFAMILWHAADRAMLGDAVALAPDAPLSPEAAMRTVRTDRGESLAELSSRQPQIVVFLRHLGCTFCREALADLALRDRELRSRNLGVVIVHMGYEREAAAMLDRYGLRDATRVNDPERVLYRAFDLKRGRFTQLFGLRVWLRGISAGLIAGHGVGSVAGDGFQMPGAFVIHDGHIVRAFRHQTAADRPDYVELASCEIPARSPQGGPA
ncbi:MAG: SelL-related redox protein [Phycisphaerae bacterium]